MIQGRVEGGSISGGGLQQQQHQPLRRGQIERVLRQQLAIDCWFRTEYTADDAAGFAATLAEAVLQPTDAIADATRVASVDDDVAPGEARFTV